MGNPHLMMRRLAAVPLVALLAVGASLALAQVQPGKGWIDQPLGWEVITAGPVAVTAHLTHPGGVTEARLMVNGEELGQVPLGGETLEMAEFTWEPPGSGQYLVEVFGFGGNEWGVPGMVEVTVALGEEPDDTTTTTEGTTTTVGATTTTKGATTTSPTTSTTSSTTTSSTTTTTVCSLGVPSSLYATGTNTLDPTLHWTYTGCLEPEWFQVAVYDPDGSVVWFAGESGSSNSHMVGGLSDCTSYTWKVRTYDSGAEGPWSATDSFFIQTVRSCP